MADRQLEQAAVLLLQQHKISAELNVESDKPSADVLTTDARGQKYLLEIKERTVSWLMRAMPVSARFGTGVRVRTDPTGPSNTISGVLKKASKQLKSFVGSENILRLVWFFANPTDRHYHYERIRHTVYGIKIVVATREGQHADREGIYVAPAAFVRWQRIIDGVLLGNFAGLFLNDLSQRYDLLKNSQIAKLCGSSVFDPSVEAKSGKYYYLPPDDSSQTTKSVAAQLERTYGIDVFELISLSRFSAENIGEPGEDGSPL